jgi:hypothetical protein
MINPWRYTLRSNSSVATMSEMTLAYGTRCMQCPHVGSFSSSTQWAIRAYIQNCPPPSTSSLYLRFSSSSGTTRIARNMIHRHFQALPKYRRSPGTRLSCMHGPEPTDIPSGRVPYIVWERAVLDKCVIVLRRSVMVTFHGREDSEMTGPSGDNGQWGASGKGWCAGVHNRKIFALSISWPPLWPRADLAQNTSHGCMTLLKELETIRRLAWNRL